MDHRTVRAKPTRRFGIWCGLFCRCAVGGVGRGNMMGRCTGTLSVQSASPACCTCRGRLATRRKLENLWNGVGRTLVGAGSCVRLPSAGPVFFLSVLRYRRRRCAEVCGGLRCVPRSLQYVDKVTFIYGQASCKLSNCVLTRFRGLLREFRSRGAYNILLL